MAAKRAARAFSIKGLNVQFPKVRQWPLLARPRHRVGLNSQAGWDGD
jgi:hypothetical protein